MHLNYSRFCFGLGFGLATSILPMSAQGLAEYGGLQLDGKGAGLGGALGSALFQAYKKGTLNRTGSNLQGLPADFQVKLTAMLKAAEAEEKAHHWQNSAKFYADLAAYRQRFCGAGDKAAGTAYLKAADLNNKANRLDQAEDNLRHALAVCARASGPGSPASMPILSRLASTCASENKAHDAAIYYQQVLTLQERNLGADNSVTSQTRLNLADTYTRAGDYKSAEPLLKQSVEIVQKNVTDNKETVELMNKYASVLKQNNKPGEADEILRQIDAIKAGASPSPSPSPSAPATP